MSATTIADAPRLGPMGRAYVDRPCGHGRWALDTVAERVLVFERRCSCGARYSIVLGDDESATITHVGAGR